jgi:hypothetical protein
MSARSDTQSEGQALEFEIWSDLIKQSKGALHVFLPLLDRGLDAVLHRLTDGRYIPLQIKGRGRFIEGMIEIVVRADSLVDDDGLLIAAPTFDVQGQQDLVVTESVFKQLATHGVSQGREVYSADFSMHPVYSRWRPYLVPHSELAECILGMFAAEPVARLEPELLEPSERHSGWLGFLGESEVIRRLAESPRLDLFRPFPDIEMVEVLARDNVSRQYAGLQVKAATVARRREAHIQVRKATLTNNPTTWLVGLAWREGTGAFDRECLVIPAADIPRVATEDGATWTINFHPSSRERTVLDPYRKPLAELSRLILDAVARNGQQPGT